MLIVVRDRLRQLSTAEAGDVRDLNSQFPVHENNAGHRRFSANPSPAMVVAPPMIRHVFRMVRPAPIEIDMAGLVTACSSTGRILAGGIPDDRLDPSLHAHKVEHFVFVKNDGRRSASLAQLSAAISSIRSLLSRMVYS